MFSKFESHAIMMSSAFTCAVAEFPFVVYFESTEMTGGPNKL